MVDGELLQQFLRYAHVEIGFGFLQHIAQVVKVFGCQTFKRKLAADIDIAMRHGEFEGFDVQNRIVGKQARSLVFGRLNQGSLNFFFAHFLHGHFGNFVFQCQK